MTMKPWISFSLKIGLFSTSLIVLSHNHSKSAELATHLAIYELSLVSADANLGIESAAGFMKIKLDNQCKNWIFSQDIELTLRTVDQSFSMINFNFSSVENQDGLQFKFNQTTDYSNDNSTQINGTANRKTFAATPNSQISKKNSHSNSDKLSDNQINNEKPSRDETPSNGQINFTLPKKKTVKLDRDTVFPMEFTIKLLDAAELGQIVFRHKVFDGSTVDNGFDASAVIGKLHPPDTTNPMTILNSGWRQIDTSYFSNQTNDEVPEFKISMQLENNGIMRGMIIDNSNYVIRGDLISVSTLAPNQVNCQIAKKLIAKKTQKLKKNKPKPKTKK